MSTSESFEAELDLIANYVEDIGHRVHEKTVPNLITGTLNGTEYSYFGHRCEAERGRYLVVAHPEFRYMSVIYLLSVTQNLAEDLDGEIAEALVNKDFEDVQEAREQAAKILLEGVDRRHMDSLKTYIFMFMSGGNQEVMLSTNKSGTLDGFTVETQFFPYEESFNIQEFYEAVRTTVHAGNRGSWLLPRSLVIATDEENPEETELQIDLNW